MQIRAGSRIFRRRTGELSAAKREQARVRSNHREQPGRTISSRGKEACEQIHRGSSKACEPSTAHRRGLSTPQPDEEDEAVTTGGCLRKSLALSKLLTLPLEKWCRRGQPASH